MRVPVPGLSRTGLLPASRPGPSVRPATTHCPYGLDRGLPFPLDDVDTADCLLLVGGSNLAETMPPIMQRITRQRDAGGSLIVVDPRRTPTAAAATLHLQASPGTDLMLANGLLFLAIELGHVDQAYVAARTQG